MVKGATQLSDTIWYVQGLNMGRYPFANSMVIDDDIKCIVDLGPGSSILKEIMKELVIDKVVFSHCHEDHVSGSFLLPDARFYAHSLDIDAIESIDKLKERYLVKGTELERVFDNFFFQTLNLKGCHIHEKITDGYVFNLGKTKLKVIHTPGHSAGHCCFLDETSGVLFSSDIDLSSLGPWYGSADCDIDDFISSIRKLIRLKIETLVSSHKGIVHDEIGPKLQRYLEKIFEREKRLFEFLGKARTFDEIVGRAIIYGKFGEPKEAYVLMESIMIKKHLERLIRSGSVAYEQGKYLAV